MTSVLDPGVDQPVPPAVDDEGGPGEPWWHAPWRLVVLGLALVFLGAAASYAVTTRADHPPGPESVDVGFLQDMRFHHDNAVAIAYAYLLNESEGRNPTLGVIAAEILLGQQLESGRMVQLLREFGQAEANTTGTSMTWMDMPTPTERMPGLASSEQLDELRAAEGPASDSLFARLMVAHHEAGLHMADTAAAEAGDGEVRALAAAMAAAQRDEILELERLAP